MLCVPSNFVGKLPFVIALAAICLLGSFTAARATAQRTAAASPHPHSTAEKHCPPQREIDAALGKASALMAQASYRDAAEALRPLSTTRCDARVSLLLAAAMEGQGDLATAEQTLKVAHSAWPDNNSVSTSLAREYLNSHQIDKAVQALEGFHPTATTPQQEMELAVMALIAGQRLASAQSVAAVNYKSYPSLHSMLLLANALQLEGKYKDVIAMLEEKRSTYSDSPAFLITLAESEYDAVLYDTARADLEHAVALDHESYQGHYLLGNVLFKAGDIEGAVSQYRVAIGLSPDQPRTYYQLAVALQSKQDKDGAQKELINALSVDNHYAPAHVEMGRILISQNQLSDAVAHLNLAIKENPNSEQGYFLLARAYAQLGDKEKSEEMAKRLVAVRSANWRTSENKEQNQPQATAPAETPK